MIIPYNDCSRLSWLIHKVIGEAQVIPGRVSDTLGSSLL